MDIKLLSVKCQASLVHLEDVVIVSKFADEPIDHLQQQLTWLNNKEIALKFKKSEFFKNPVDYTGHPTEPGPLEVDSFSIEAFCCIFSNSRIT